MQGWILKRNLLLATIPPALALVEGHSEIGLLLQKINIA